MKKVISVFLAVLMIVTIVPFSAFSEEVVDDSSSDLASDVSYQATNTIGDLILSAANESAESKSNDYAIQSVSVSGTTATTEIISTDECTLVIAIYDNDCITMLGSGKTDIEANESTKNSTVTTEIEIEEMPEYYYVKAFLLDSENSPLCTNYETREYTKEFEEFLAKTTYDFDEYYVINLDESDTNNFLVVSDDAIVIEKTENENIVVRDDYENGLYVIENVSDDMKKLNPGDVFYYKYGEGIDEYIIAKIHKIDIDGDTVTITADEADNLYDYFQYAKIDTEATQTTFDPTEMDEDATHEPIYESQKARSIDVSLDGIHGELNGEASVGDKWNITKEFDNGAKLKFTVSTKLKFSCKLYLDVNWIGSKYAYFEAIFSYDANFNVSLSGAVEIPPITLGSVGLDTDLGIKADAKISFIMEGKIKIDINFTLMEGAIGFAFDTDVGAINKCKAAAADFVPDLKEEATIFIGISIKPEIEATKYIQVSLEAKAGIQLTGKLPLTSDDSKKHECSICFDITASAVVNCEFKVKIFKIVDNTCTLGEYSTDLGVFYLSLDIGFGGGTCPNISYKINVIVTDQNGDAVNGVTVNEKYTTDNNGSATLYLKNGNHTITAQYADSEAVSKNITVADNGKTIELTINVNSAESDDTDLGDSDINDDTHIDPIVPEKPENCDIPETAVYCNDSYYQLYNNCNTWQEAKEYCESLGGHLAVINDEEENSFLYNYITAQGVQSAYFGFSDYDVEKEWKWIDGYNSDYVNWHSGEPNSENTNEDYAMFYYKYSDGSWNDGDFGNRTVNSNKYYICEWENNDEIYENTSGEMASGTCGDNLTWTLYNDGELVISGTGAMFDWSYYSRAPWDSYRSSIKSVVIEKSVTTIGNDAFWSCDSLENVTIGNSVKSIGREAFCSCKSLESVTIGNSVTTIGDFAFYDCTSLESVTIGNSVTTIGDFAFNNCTSLESIEIPDSVTTIGEYAFRYCDSLESVTIGNSVTTIGGAAFYGCDSLESITIPDSVTIIGNCAFSACTSLESVTVDGNNLYYLSDEYGVLFNKDKTELIQYPVGNSRTDYTIPDSVTTIGDCAFRICNSLESVTIPDSVTTIGDYAFGDCTSLESIEIPDSVTTIGDSAFEYCDSLESVTIGNSVKIIGDSAFEYCDSLESVTIPDSVTTIGDFAFDYCDSLESVTIGNSVTTIGDFAFKYCTSLESVTVDGNNLYYSSDEYGVLFNKDKTELIQYPVGNSRTDYTIPDSVTTIGEYAFQYCDSLERVTIPDSVTTIGNSAFEYCTNLKTVDYKGTEDQWKNINIGGNNSSLINATIVYNSSDSAKARSMAYPVNYNAVVDETAMNTAITSAVVGNEYVMLIVRDENAEDLLAADNLLFIDQKTADGETLIFEFNLKDNESDYKILFTNSGFEFENHEHISGEWEVLTEAQVGADGLEQQKCTICGEVLDERVIPALDDSLLFTLGDVNGDSKITAADARLALRISAQLELPTDAQILAADLTFDGKVTAADARKILRISANLDTI